MERDELNLKDIYYHIFIDEKPYKETSKEFEDIISLIERKNIFENWLLSEHKNHKHKQHSLFFRILKKFKIF